MLFYRYNELVMEASKVEQKKEEHRHGKCDKNKSKGTGKFVRQEEIRDRSKLEELISGRQ